MRGRAVSDDLRGRVRAATRTLSIEGRKEKKDKTRRKKKKKKKKKKTSRSGDDEGEKKAKKDEKRRKEERRRLIIEKKKKKKEKTGRDRQEEGRTRGGSEEGESSAFRRGGGGPFLGCWSPVSAKRAGKSGETSTGDQTAPGQSREVANTLRSRSQRVTCCCMDGRVSGGTAGWTVHTYIRGHVDVR
ncbi:hypothetical protein H113_02199 [Trichophyton rubrum MR1459]|uniref:Uncharacterized protein n=1 Tax=Trichophyton rubrum CBS 288.86 TaxID=1215330 RepID=A0A022WAP3_TRIRU|nr:hypothetical protein H100_02192 [Trichophyton rubrum MR850]EZF44534.1 hypothetical protein H102_02189 [Trichophyton rubrum CBS 100081]EZF55191.1 hypothetical protein H103_02198 [Trichophyton rubrum CBS 288.86]EZF65806.1 hypothetical protein H104_02173 [Trichophyton rubrum CBS 289.86]EZF87124.1 hypothetical protein H110_02194 [Trichophyton rubrum MR1448]EZF97861.1 hypothetical protein H113_02199 [Trichophyton rubrum MR1459]EZG19446.1 hypothetical protein H107_02263 [Trichophyton rubrum CBS 